MNKKWSRAGSISITNLSFTVYILFSFSPILSIIYLMFISILICVKHRVKLPLFLGFVKPFSEAFFWS